jgi:hypothetical protein
MATVGMSIAAFEGSATTAEGTQLAYFSDGCRAMSRSEWVMADVWIGSGRAGDWGEPCAICTICSGDGFEPIGPIEATAGNFAAPGTRASGTWKAGARASAVGLDRAVGASMRSWLEGDLIEMMPVEKA